MKRILAHALVAAHARRYGGRVAVVLAAGASLRGRASTTACAAAAAGRRGLACGRQFVVQLWLQGSGRCRSGNRAPVPQNEKQHRGTGNSDSGDESMALQFNQMVSEEEPEKVGKNC